MKRLIMCFILILFFVAQVFGMPGVVEWEAYWDANTEGDLAGYYLYYRSVTESFDDTRRLDCGLSVSQILTGVIPDDVFISLTAYDISMNESEFCEEIFYDKDSSPPSCTSGFGVRKSSN